jgi:uncharacterized protein (UPF0216 family)
MKLDYFLKKEKINRILAYVENKDGNKIYFGWKEIKDISLNTKLVLSKTKTKDIYKIDVATVNDYKLFFKASTGEDPFVFLEKWSNNKKLLKNLLLNNKKEKYLQNEEIFWIKMAELITLQKSFTKYGISYKVLDLE